MKIESKGGANGKVLTWADFDIDDNEGRLIKSITLKIVAGDLVNLDVESYNTNFSNTQVPTSVTHYHNVGKVLIETSPFDRISIDKKDDKMPKLNNSRRSNINPILELELE
jgi:hypothetical protein